MTKKFTKFTRLDLLALAGRLVKSRQSELPEEGIGILLWQHDTDCAFCGDQGDADTVCTCQPNLILELADGSQMPLMLEGQAIPPVAKGRSN